MEVKKIIERGVLQKAKEFSALSESGKSKTFNVSRRSYSAFRFWVSSKGLTGTIEYHFVAKSKESERGKLTITKK